MKASNIRFFSPTENRKAQPETQLVSKPPQIALAGYVSSGGKLMFPNKMVSNLGIDLDTTLFKVGMEEGKRKAKQIYLVPTSNDQESFRFEKAAKSYTLALPFILKKYGVDFSKAKFGFTIQLFEYEGTPSLELQMAVPQTTTKAPYTGKPRGRKPRQVEVAQ